MIFLCHNVLIILFAVYCLDDRRDDWGGNDYDDGGFDGGDW